MSDFASLDNPAWSALTGPHSHLAQLGGRARRYRPEVTFFTAVSDFEDPEAWHDLAELIGPGTEVVLTGRRPIPPLDWRWGGGTGEQYLYEGADARPDEEAVVLGAADLPEMIELSKQPHLGLVHEQQLSLGTYVGIRREDKLIAMAGERLHPAGFTEVSAVATQVEHRGQGLAQRLVLAVCWNILQRGEQPFLHTDPENHGAKRLYERMDFRLRALTTWVHAITPTP